MSVLFGTSPFFYVLVIGWSLSKKEPLGLSFLTTTSLLLRHVSLCTKSFYILASLVNPRFMPQHRDANDSAIPLSTSSNFTLLAVSTERFKRSFIPSMLFRQ